MRSQELSSGWRMHCLGEDTWIDAVVPGTVYTDLLREGRMEDPFWKDYEDQAWKLMEEDYEYETCFEAADSLFESSKILLRFDGIDTIADIFLNGEKIGAAENMHRIWEFDVTKSLARGRNTLRVRLHSPNRCAREAFENCRTLGSEDAMDGFVHIRKAHCMYGWDWGAHLPDAGIFRRVSLIGIEQARLDDVYVIQQHTDGRVELEVRIKIEEAASSIEKKDQMGAEGVCLPSIQMNSRQYEIRLSLFSPDGELLSETSEWSSTTEFHPGHMIVENPELWWPNGYGEQPLYRMRVELISEGRVLDIWEKRIGLRTMTMRREKDEWGESFAHEINGVCIFAMGADYIPEDHLIGRTSPEKTRRLLEDSCAANFNTIRVWGGGYYPEDWFFDLCDELGLIVWQDFMFACAVYELTSHFKENIRREFIDNIKRIRHHACLGLWCGNNEMEQFVSEKHHWVTKPSEVRDYIIMYEQLIPEVLKEYDPQTFYWPASPSSGGSFDEPNDPDRGDVHYWQVWHGNKPFSEYRKYFFRYASEFGFQSFPCRKTIETFTDDERDYNPFSYIMEKHQRNYGANGKIMNYMQQTFLYPTSFDSFLYASQLLQGEAIRYGVEHFRRNRGRCMGAIYWQLNDCWPVISWASIDYTGRWKALHYYAKRFFAPVMISCQEEGMMTQEADMNREHFVFEKSICLNVANETRKVQKGTVFWEVRNAKGISRRCGRCDVVVLPLSRLWLDKELMEDVDIFREYVSYRFEQEDGNVSEGSVLFSYPKYFQYEDPKLSYEIEGDEIILHADAYAASVEIANAQEDLVLSDNYFDMNAGEKRVKIIRGAAEGIRLRSVYDIR